MSDALLTWLVPVAIALHNLEEALWLPAWSQERAGRWRRSVGARPFRFAVSVLTCVAFVIAAGTRVRGPGSLAHYLLASYALGQGLSVVFPHLIVTIATRTYAPGLLSGLLLVLPSATAFLWRSFAAGQLRVGRFLVVAGAFIPLMLLSIPVLFKAGRAACFGREQSDAATQSITHCTTESR